MHRKIGRLWDKSGCAGSFASWHFRVRPHPRALDALLRQQVHDALLADEMRRAHQHEIGARPGKVPRDRLGHAGVAVVEQHAIEFPCQFRLSGLLFEESEKLIVRTGEPGAEHAGKEGLELRFLVQRILEKLDLHGHGLTEQQVELGIDAFEFQNGPGALFVP